MFLNLFTRAYFWVGVVAGMGNGSVVALVVMGGSGERFGRVGSGIGKEIVGGVIVDSEEFESSATPRTGGGTSLFLGSFVEFSTYWGGGS